MLDCLVIGAGLIGRALAWELSRHGLSVELIDPGSPRPTASWAAAGILPPPLGRESHDPMERIRAMSHAAYAPWCAELTRHSNIDVGFQACGGLYLGRQAGETAALQASLEQWQADGIRVESVAADDLAVLEPRLCRSPPPKRVYFLPDEAQVRPNRLLQALQVVLRQAGVTERSNVTLRGWKTVNGHITSAETSAGSIVARKYCVCAGPWSTQLLQTLDFELPVEPRRGQIARWKFEVPLLTRIVNEGPRYLLARHDGTLLAGSTVEDVGFDNRTTEAGINELIEFATSLLPEIAGRPPVDQWSGLRPHSRDGLPYIGALSPWQNLFVASGHFRSGVHLAPATATLLSQLLREEAPELDLRPFDPCRT